MKNYDIELQRLKAIGRTPGLLELQVDMMVQTLAAREEGGQTTSRLTLSEDTGRLLFTLLRQQLVEIDKRKGRSQR